MKKLILRLAMILSLQAGFAQEPVKCTGKTKSGAVCKNNAVVGAAFCRLHDPSAPRCGSIKKDGQPCRMLVNKAGDRCHYHNPVKP